MAWKIFLIFFLIFITGLILYPCFKKEKKQSQVCFKNHCFSAELALTTEQKRTGLMFRQGLDKDKGMLVVYEKEGEHSSWMKNVLIPLDIIWLSKDKKVVYIAENCQPCPELPCPTIRPDKAAKYVFEINGGLASEMSLSVGDKLEFKID